jgi:hypothetical protein
MQLGVQWGRVDLIDELLRQDGKSNLSFYWGVFLGVIFVLYLFVAQILLLHHIKKRMP